MTGADQPTVVLRCDGTSRTGLGHTSRLLALAEALADIECRCLFVGRYEAQAQAILRAAGVPWETPDAVAWSEGDARALGEAASRTSACGLVVDSYLVGADYLERAESYGTPLLLVDDFGALHRYDCSGILNFTVRAEELPYPRDRRRCFLGPRWFLGRRALRQLRVRGVRPVGPVERVLVAAGGSDPWDIGLPVVESLLSCERRLSVHVVVGAAYPAIAALEALLTGFAGETAIRSGLPGLWGELGWADLCISGAGLTKYETAYLGLPAGVVPQNEGQARDAARFAAEGLALDLGLASRINPERLAADVRRLVHDRELRAALQRAAVTVFPADPTRDLAAAVLADVFHGSAL